MGIERNLKEGPTAPSGGKWMTVKATSLTEGCEVGNPPIVGGGDLRGGMRDS